jgi:cell volume regulation protein A
VFSHELVETLHTVSLSMLLFYAGLNADLQHIRGFLRYGVLLAVGGVVISSLLLGGLIWLAYGAMAAALPAAGIQPLPLGLALMVAGCLASTDAGATMGVLRSVRSLVPQRIRALLEFESSLNDPAAVLFLFLLIGLNSADHAGGDVVVLGVQVQAFLKGVGTGVMVGLVLTYVAQFVISHLVTSRDQILIVGIAIAIAAFGCADLLHGSGLVAAYVTGLFLANNIYDNDLITPDLLENSLEPFNTMMEITVFLLFGALVKPLHIVQALPQGLLVALLLMLIVRPFCVLLLQRWSPFEPPAGRLIAWCGLRGAVSLALAYTVVNTIPALHGVAPAQVAPLQTQVEGLIFAVVFFNLLIQGLTLPPFCRRLAQGRS